MKSITIVFLAFIVVFTSCNIEGVEKNTKNASKDSIQSKNDTLSVDNDSLIENVAFVVDTTIAVDSAADNFIELANGVTIKWFKKGNGSKIYSNDVVMMDYTGRIVKSGDVFDSNAGANSAIPVMLGFDMIASGWEQALLHMKVGDQAEIFIPSKEAYGKTGDKLRIPGDADLKIALTIKDKIVPEVVSGVKIYHLKDYKKGKETIKVDDQVKLHYVGYTPRGMFYTSYKDKKTLNFKVGEEKIIEGLNIAVQKMQIKEKAMVFIPSEKAYGKEGLLNLVKPDENVMYYISIFK